MNCLATITKGKWRIIQWQNYNLCTSTTTDYNVYKLGKGDMVARNEIESGSEQERTQGQPICSNQLNLFIQNMVQRINLFIK